VIDQAIGLVAHLKLNDILKGASGVRFELVVVDLTDAHDLAQTLRKLKDADLSAAFTIAPPSPPFEVEAPAGGDATHGSEPSPPATLDEWRAAFDTWEPLKREAFAEYRFEHGITKDATDAERLDAYSDFDSRYGFHDVATQAPVRPVTPPKPGALPVVVDEGLELSASDVEAAGKRYGLLPADTRSWVTVTGGRVRLSPAHGGRPTVRRFELLRGLCALAEAGFDNDDMVWAIAHHILGDIVWQGAPAAAVVAALDLEEAARFARMCDALAGAANVSLRYTDDGRAVLEPSVLGVAA
jgi:hypothetical protein